MFKKSQQFLFCILHPACVLLSVCSLHFTLSLQFTPGPPSAVRSLRFTLTVSLMQPDDLISAVRSFRGEAT